MSGADDGKVYVLSPDSWSPFIWDYNIEEVSALLLAYIGATRGGAEAPYIT